MKQEIVFWALPEGAYYFLEMHNMRHFNNLIYRIK